MTPQAEDVYARAREALSVHQRAGEGEVERLTRERDDALAESRRWADRWAIGGEHHSILLVVEGLEAERDEARAALSSQRAGEPTPDEVERAAKAIHHKEWVEKGYGPWEKCVDQHRIRAVARAALDAARQPKGER